MRSNNRKKISTRVAAAILAASIMCGTIPATVFADETENIAVETTANCGTNEIAETTDEAAADATTETAGKAVEDGTTETVGKAAADLAESAVTSTPEETKVDENTAKEATGKENAAPKSAIDEAADSEIDDCETSELTHDQSLFTTSTENAAPEYSESDFLEAEEEGDDLMDEIYRMMAEQNKAYEEAIEAEAEAAKEAEAEAAIEVEAEAAKEAEAEAAKEAEAEAAKEAEGEKLKPIVPSEQQAETPFDSLSQGTFVCGMATDAAPAAEETSDDVVVVTEEDRKEAIKDVEAAKKKAAEDEKKAREKRTQLIKDTAIDLGKTLYTQITENSGKDAGEIIKSIAIGTLKVLNQDLIKNIPYIGNLLNNLGNAVLNDDVATVDPTQQALSTISTQLNQIDNTIRECTKEVTERQDIAMSSEVIKAINDSYNNVTDFYTAYSSYFNDAVNILATTEENDASRVCAEDSFAKIYTPEDEITSRKANNETYFTTYRKFLNQLTDGGKLCENYASCQNNIFDAYDKVCGMGKNGEFALMEYEDSRRNMEAAVEENIQYGYDVLHTAITVDMDKQEILMVSYNEAMTAVQEALKEMDKTSSEYAALSTTYNELKKQYTYCQTARNADSNALDLLVKEKAAADCFLENRNTTLDNFEKAYTEASASLKNEYVNIDCAYSFGKETVKGKTAYPHLNADKTVIEYRDEYGNLMATRKINGYKEVSKDDVKVGNYYKFTTGKLVSLVSKEETVMMQVSSIDMGSWYEPRCACGYDDNFQYRKLSIGAFGDYNIYELSVGELTIAA